MSNIAGNEGVLPTLNTLRQFDRDIRRLRQQVNSLGLRKRAQNPAPITDTVNVFNDAATTCPEGGVMILDTFQDDRFNLERPTSAAEEELFVILREMAANATGAAFLPEYGRTYRVAADDYASVTIGDRLGTIANAFDLAIDYMGPFIVMAKIATPIVEARWQPVFAPPLLKTTGAAGGGLINAKQVDQNFAVTGDNRAFITQ